MMLADKIADQRNDRYIRFERSENPYPMIFIRRTGSQGEALHLSIHILVGSYGRLYLSLYQNDFKIDEIIVEEDL
jgi:hypothetical protein